MHNLSSGHLGILTVGRITLCRNFIPLARQRCVESPRRLSSKKILPKGKPWVGFLFFAPMQGTGKIILQLVYHREQVDIEHADIMIDKQTAVYREVVAAECRHDVPYARCDFAAAVNGRGRIERSESGDFVDESVVLEPFSSTT